MIDYDTPNDAVINTVVGMDDEVAQIDDFAGGGYREIGDYFNNTVCRLADYFEFALYSPTQQSVLYIYT